jgi:hypothetical protein
MFPYDKPCPLFIWKKKESHDGGFVFGGMAVSQAHKDLIGLAIHWM